MHVYWHFYFILLIKFSVRDFLGGPVVKDSPSSAGDMDSIPSWETKISSGAGQLSLHAHHNWRETCVSQPEKLIHCNEEPAHHNWDLKQPNK